MIRKMGPLRHYSCRASERNIKSHTNLIKSTSKPGVNASNILLNQNNMDSYGISELLRDFELDSTQRLNPESFEDVYPGQLDSPQIWEKQATYQLLGDSTLCAGLPDTNVVNALRSYYQRLFRLNAKPPLDSNSIQLAKRYWSNTTVYSSVLYRGTRMTTRANYFVLFESVRPRM